MRIDFDQMYAVDDVDAILEGTRKVVQSKLRTQLREADIEDVAQEVVIEVYAKYKQKYDPERSSFQTFMNGFINNAIMSECRKLRTGKATLLSSAAQIVESFEDENDTELFSGVAVGVEDCGYTHIEMETDIEKNIGLSKQENEVFRMARAGLENKEIAGRLGVSHGRVCQIIKQITTKYYAAVS